MENHFEKQTGQDGGPEKVYQFLSRSGFLDTLADPDTFHQWMEKLNFKDFEDHLIRLNGIVREVQIKNRGIYDQGVSLQDQHGDISYLPPRAEDKLELMEKTFQAAKNLPEKDAVLLLYYSLQAIHPFVDGNGRTGRLLYLLMEKGDAKASISRKELEDFLVHDGSSGLGRERFTNKVRSPETVYPIVEQLLARDVVGSELIDRVGRIYSGLQGGSIEGIANEKISDETKRELEYVISESNGGNFSFRNIVLMKFLQNQGLFEQQVSEDTERKLLRFDGEQILKDASESDAKEIIAIFKSLKKQFVEKLIDIISNSEEYEIGSGQILKDLLYQ